MRKLSGLALFLAFLFAGSAAAQQGTTIRGRVTIASDGSALPGATVAIDELNLRTVSDAQGQYELVVPASAVHGQSVKLAVTMEGFQPRTSNINLTPGTMTHDVGLKLGFGQEITVGSRAVGAEQEQAVPVDVIPQRQIESSPSTETNQVIQKIA